MAQGSIPTLRHLARPALFFHAEGHLVDLTRSAEHSNRNSTVVIPPLGIGHVLKEERLSLAVRQTLVLPPYQGHQLAVFFDPCADAVKIAALLQKRNKVPEIAKVRSWLGFESRLRHGFSSPHLTNSIGLGRTSFLACSMGNSFSQNGHLAAIFIRSN